MKYDHMVYKDGKLYKPGDDVPDEILSLDENEPLPFTPEPEVTQTYTKTDINRMNVDELRNMATEYGIPNAGLTNGTELKKLLIEKLGL